MRRGAIFFDFDKHGHWYDDIALVSQLGLTMAGSILLCFGIGYLLDRWLGTRGVFITVFILLGIAGGGWTVYRQITRVLDPKGKHEPDNGNENGNG